MVLFALYPQFKLWSNRGHEFHGAYAYNDIDEVAYSAYLQALIDGRARRNDPYTGADLTGAAPLHESLFSVQFATPMVIARPARVLHLSASTMMIVVAAISAFASALALFYLLGVLTGDSRLAAVGALAVLCLGTLAAGEGAIYELTGRGVAYPYFPFLRRYLPALPFPVIFLFCAAVWRALTSSERRRQLVWSVAAILAFGFLVYSYFYLWTAAAAFFVCFGSWWILFKPNGKRNLNTFALIGGGAGLIALPYFWLLSQRDPGVEDLTVLVTTHRPDLTRVPEIVVFVTLLVLAIAIGRKRLNWRDPVLGMTVGVGFCVLAVFNQQVLTGRSLQPIHYQVFVGNYLAALAAFLSLWLWWRGRRPIAIARPIAVAVIAVVALGWGAIEAKYTTRVLDAVNVVRDQAVPVERQLAAEAEKGGEAARAKTVLALNLIQSDDQPTFAPQPVLWARHQYAFTGTSWVESKRRFFQMLYYNGVTPDLLDAELKQGNFVYLIALFGWGRPTDRLTAEPNPLTDAELNAEVAQYAEFAMNFDRRQAVTPELSLVVTHARSNIDFSNLDEWYERDAGEKCGDFVLYRVKLRP
jgi:hypothetical protein